MPFEFTELLPLGADHTPYRLLTRDYVSTFEAQVRNFLKVDPQALTLLNNAFTLMAAEEWAERLSAPAPVVVAGAPSEPRADPDHGGLDED